MESPLKRLTLTSKTNPFIAGMDKVTRGSEIKLKGLLDSEPHVALSACGPDEVAWDIEFQGGTRRGPSVSF